MTAPFWGQDRSLLQTDVKTVRKWRATNCMKISVSKTRDVCFTRKTNMIAFMYKLCGAHINRTDIVKDRGVFLDSKFYFRQYVDYIFSRALKLLCLLRA
jgi:hypothetical protein